jgi:hypothetical protein
MSFVTPQPLPPPAAPAFAQRDRESEIITCHRIPWHNSDQIRISIFHAKSLCNSKGLPAFKNLDFRTSRISRLRDLLRGKKEGF